MYIHTYTYMYTYVCVYIYIYTHVYLVGPGNSLDVSAAFPLRFHHVSINVSATFPSCFPCVSVRASAALPLGRRLPDGNYPKKLAPHWLRSQTCFGAVAPTSSRNLRSRVRSQGSTFSGASSDMLPISASLGFRCDVGPKAALTRMCFNVFAAASDNLRFALGSRCFKCVVCFNVSVTFPSTFPSRFHQRFRHVSVNFRYASVIVSVTFPLGRCVPDGNYPETLPAFPEPTKHIYIYIYMYIDICRGCKCSRVLTVAHMGLQGEL